MYGKKQEKFKELFEELISNRKEIYVNAAIGALIGDLPEITLGKVDKLNIVGEPYNIASYKECNVFLNPYKKWTDLTIDDKEGNKIFDFEGKIDPMELI